ncbi:alpha-2,8-sialyltransferase 8B-like isoform X2 [Branchiostoma floridae x Branchiostoma belcheri]
MVTNRELFLCLALFVTTMLLVATLMDGRTRMFHLPKMVAHRSNGTRTATGTPASRSRVALSPDQTMDRIQDHFNMEQIRQIQNITGEYFDPKQNIIDFEDIDIFLKKCNPADFTLLSSAKKPCDVTHTHVTHYRTCAVVGNGGILLTSGCGAEIDAHEFVIRNNLPPTGLYATDVGKKTNLTTINRSKLWEVCTDLGPKNKTARTAVLTRLRESPGMIFSYSLSTVGSPAQSKLKAIDRVIRDNRIPVTLAFSHQSEMGNKGLYSKLAGKRWRVPSTGVNTFALASTFCDRISMYGYYPLPTYNDRNVSYHYYDQGSYGRWHKMEQEFDMFQKFHNQGIIRHVIELSS